MRKALLSPIDISITEHGVHSDCGGGDGAQHCRARKGVRQWTGKGRCFRPGEAQVEGL